MTLRDAIAETIKRADRDQEFLRQTLARRRAEAEAAEAQAQPQMEQPATPPRTRPENHGRRG